MADKQVVEKMYIRKYTNTKGFDSIKIYRTSEDAVKDDDKRLEEKVYIGEFTLIGEIRRTLIPLQQFQAVSVELTAGKPE